MFTTKTYTALLLALMLCLHACAEEALPPTLSDACLLCLTERNDDGCQTDWHACDGNRECGQYAECQLQAVCFARSPGDGCEAEVGCRRPPIESTVSGSDAGSAQLGPRDLAANFERCARTTCASICGFVRP